MRINIVSVEDSLISLGVRKVSSFVRQLNPDTKVFYIPLTNFFSLWNVLRPRYAGDLDPQRDAEAMAADIADADIVAFSSMTHVAAQTKILIAAVRRANPKAFIIWGGIHPIIVPEDAIKHADAICTGEGEFAFEEFFEAYRHGRDYTQTRNFWFNKDGNVTRNDFRPLMTNDEMNRLPLPTYANDEMIYEPKKRRYEVMTKSHYLKFTGLTYHTIWTIGCPFKCTFCANTKFIENDKTYTRLRFPSAEWLVNEIKAARKIHPHLSNVILLDDSMVALPLKVLTEFSAIYKAEIGLPLFVAGIIPNYVKRDKVEVLLEAGMTTIRMGIQSGSRRVLDFYKRPAPPERVLAATDIFADYTRYMIPPSYDFILDNPIETREDLIDTLELIYKMRRPFTLNLFSLRMQPNTTMADQFKELNIRPEDLASESYKSLRPTYANGLMVLLTLIKPPRFIFDRLLRGVRGVSDEQKLFPLIFFVLHTTYVFKRGFSHLRFMDFTRIPGRIAWTCWKLGIVGFWHRRVIRKFKRKTPIATKPRATNPVSLPKTSVTSSITKPTPQPSQKPYSLALPVIPE